MRLLPPHDWPCPFVVAGNGTSCGIKFKQQPRKYKGTRFYDVCALVIKRWPNCVDEDASGLTFYECNPTGNVDSLQMPVTKINYSTELEAADFQFCEVFPLQLEAAACSVRCTLGWMIRHQWGKQTYSGPAQGQLIDLFIN